MSTFPPIPSCLKRTFYYLLADNCLKMELFLKMEAEYNDIIKKKRYSRNVISYRLNVTVKSATHEVYHTAKN
jgi:hypothetical protein